MNHERFQIEAALGMIAGSRWIAALSLALALLAAIVIVLPAWGGRAAVAAASLTVLAGIAQCYFALRLAIDARLLSRLRALLDSADPQSALAQLDGALKSLGWLPDARPGRPLETRIQGIARLVRWQGGVTLVQALLVPVIGWMGRG